VSDAHKEEGDPAIDQGRATAQGGRYHHPGLRKALFGFQLIAMLTNGFDQLPPSAKMMHTFAIPQIPKALELRPANSNSRDGRRLLEHFRFGK
jgi:hypothetical protein